MLLAAVIVVGCCETPMMALVAAETAPEPWNGAAGVARFVYSRIRCIPGALWASFALGECYPEFGAAAAGDPGCGLAAAAVPYASWKHW